jgi:hypothetical protein
MKRDGDAKHTTLRRWKIVIGIVLLALIAMGTVAWGIASPSNERGWVAPHARMPEAVFAGDTVHVSGIRNFTYTSADSFTIGYYDRSYDLSQLESAWFVLVPFSTGWRGPAHSFVSFGFADSQFVAISVEARREQGETYGTMTGLFRRFELLYVVGDERDLIGLRARFHSGPVYVYPIRAPREKMREMLIGMLERANALRRTPEFYNTLTNNCSSNVVDHVNQVAPNTVQAGWKTMLPGYSDEVAYALGLLDSDLSLAQARERFVVNERARRHAHDPHFSLRIRESHAAQSASAAATDTVR